jgi:beta-xylosidase
MVLRYKNPVYPEYFADPFVMKVGAGYWAYGTGSHVDHGRQPDGRFLPILRSKDLVTWEYVGGAVAPVAGMSDYWAPEVAERGGRFYLYYSAGTDDGMTHRLRVAVADRPEGPFTDQGKELLPGMGFTIDAHPFHDPVTGRWWLFFARDFFDQRVGTGTAVVELADDMVSVKGEPRTVLRASADWQVYERNRSLYGKTWDPWHTVEGPFVVIHGGKYYCFYSGGLWKAENYGVSYGVADRAEGPYIQAQPEGPIVLTGVPGKVLGPGHCSIVTGPDGREYVCYHAWDVGMTARRLCIDPLVWTEKGPRCEGPSGI